MEHKKKLGVAVGCIAGAALLALAGYQAYMATRPVEQAMAKEVLVETQTATSGSLALSTDYIGHVQPDESVSVFPKVTGTVAATYFDVGDTVKKGDLLFEIDPQDVQLQVNVAAAAFQATSAQIAQALGSTFDMQIIQSEGSMESAQRQWSTTKKNYDKYEDTFSDQTDALSETVQKAKALMDGAKANYDKAAAAYDKQLDAYQDRYGSASSPPKPLDSGAQGQAWIALQTAKTNMNDADAAYQGAKKSYQTASGSYDSLTDGYDANYESLKAAKNSAAIAYDMADRIYELTKGQVRDEATTTAMAQLNQARASYESALHQLEYTKIYSPIDGVVEAKGVQDLNMTSTQGPAYVVSNKTLMTVVFNVSADAAGVLEVGDAIQVANGAKSYQAIIVEIGTKVSETSGLFPVKARIESDDPTLLTGITVKVSAQTRKADSALLIPLDAIYYEQASAYVYVYRDGVAVKTPVEIGLTDSVSAQVLSGIEAADQLITTWNPGLTDGAQVSLANSTPAASSSSSSEAPASQSQSQGQEILPAAGE